MDVGQTEILLAQKLSSGEPRIRKKAFYRLEQRINAQSAKNACSTKEDFLKVWKGLYYCFWLQDKPLMQEELVDSITNLLRKIRDTNQKLLFIEGFYEEIGKSWHNLDQWRMDKFLMFYRRMLRQIFHWFKKDGWNDDDAIKPTFDVLRRMILNPNEDTYPVGLKLHFVSVYLDELDDAGAGELSEEQTFHFLTPYFDVLTDRSTSDMYFNTILDEIFKLILEYCADHQFGTEEESERSSNKKPVLKFNLERIKSSLFEIGKSKTVTSKRRRRLYDLVNKYNLLIEGRNPFCEEMSDIEYSSDSEVEHAASNLLKMETGLKTKRSINSSLRAPKEGKKRKITATNCEDNYQNEDCNSEKLQDAKKRKKKANANRRILKPKMQKKKLKVKQHKSR